MATQPAGPPLAHRHGLGMMELVVTAGTTAAAAVTGVHRVSPLTVTRTLVVERSSRTRVRATVDDSGMREVRAMRRISFVASNADMSSVKICRGRSWHPTAAVAVAVTVVVAVVVSEVPLVLVAVKDQ